MIEVDLRAAIIPPQTRVWRLFPGSSYKFLPTFDEERVAFFDLPGLELPEGDLGQANDLVARVLAAQQTAKEMRLHGRDHNPELNPADFLGQRLTRTRGRYRQAVINFFEIARRGDIIVVPSTLQDAELRIGQFTHSPNRRVNAYYRQQYGRVPLPARPIKWLATVPEHQTSKGLRATLRNENFFTLIERSLFIEILSFAFDSFQFGDQYSSVVYNEKDDYSDRDTALIIFIAKLAASYCQEIEEDGIAADASILTRFLSSNSIEYSCSQSSDIHSEGFSRFVSAKVTPLILVASLGVVSALSGSNNIEELKDNRDNIAITNSLAPDDNPCTAIVSEATQRLLNGMNIDDLWSMCERMKESQARAGLQPGVEINVMPDE